MLGTVAQTLNSKFPIQYVLIINGKNSMILNTSELKPFGPYLDVSSSLTYGTVVGSHMATMPYPCYPRGSQESSVPPRKKSNQLRDVKGESVSRFVS